MSDRFLRSGRGGRTTALALLATLTVALALPSLAAAARPERFDVDMPDQFVLPAGSACAFDLRVDVLANGERYKLWLDEDGNPTRGTLNGRLVLQLTNPETDASVALNVSGPGHDRYNADGSIATAYTGRGVPLFDGVFYLSVGRDEFVVSDEWEMLDHGPASGRSVDICGLLG